MRPIQIILAGLFALVLAKYLGWFRSRLLDRLLLVLLSIAGIGLSLAPDWTTDLAHVLGVGRGVDLVMYLSIFGLGFFSILLYAKSRALEAKTIELVRALAIRDCRGPGAAARDTSGRRTAEALGGGGTAGLGEAS
jgi:small membrane protein